MEISNELIELIKSGKSEEVLKRIENLLKEPNNFFIKDFKKLKERWKNYDMGIFLKLYTPQNVIEFQIKELSDFLEKTKLKEKLAEVSSSSGKISENRMENKYEIIEKKDDEIITFSNSQTEYSRNQLPSILYFFIGFSLLFGTLRDKEFIILYDGLRLLLGVFSIIISIWGFITPYIVLTNQEILIRPDIFKQWSINYREISNIENGFSSITISTDSGNSYVIKNRILKSKYRETLYNQLADLKNKK